MIAVCKKELEMHLPFRGAMSARAQGRERFGFRLFRLDHEHMHTS